MIEKKISVKNLYFIFVICAGLIVLGIGSTYAVFTAEAELISPIALSSNLSSENNLIETISVEVPAGETITSAITVTNDSDEPINYVVFYVDEGYNIFLDAPSGSALGSLEANSNDSIEFGIYNSEANDVTVIVGVVSSTESVSLGENMKPISEIVGNTLVNLISSLYDNASKTVINDFYYAEEVSLMNDRMQGSITSGLSDDYNAGNIRYYGYYADNYIDIGDVYTEDTVIDYLERNRENSLFMFDYEDSATCYEEIDFSDTGCSDAEDVEACEEENRRLMNLIFSAENEDEICGSETKLAGEPKLYRIVGLFKNVKLADGTTSDLVKVVRDEPIGTFAWDIDPDTLTGTADWSNSTLQYILNNQYYNSENVEHSFVDFYYAYAGSPTLTTSTSNFNDFGLNSSVQKKIEEVIWDMETIEMEIDTTWTGKVMLPYYSDLIFSSDLAKDISICSDSTSEDYNYADCIVYGSWFKNGFSKWYFNYMQSDDIDSALMSTYWAELLNGGFLYPVPTYVGGSAYPTFYLASNVAVLSGDGSEENPYVIN